jgi:hypothetical protein
VSLKGDAKHTVVLDWDGTMVSALWPERPTTFMPGAVQACFAMHRAGIHLLLASARLNPYDPFTSRARPASIVEEEARYIRDMLDNAGLTFIDIWRLPGKASGSLYVDDKAIRYTGRPRSWYAVTEKVFALLGEEEPSFPVFRQEVAEK